MLCESRELNVFYCQRRVKALWGGFDFNCTARDVNSNEGYRETHIDGVLDAAVKAVLGALLAVAAYIKELAMSVFDWIYEWAKNLLMPIINLIHSGIEKAVEEFLRPIINIIDYYLGTHEEIGDFGGRQPVPENVLDDAAFALAIFTGLLAFVGIIYIGIQLFIGLTALENVAKTVTLGSAELILLTLIPFVLSMIVVGVSLVGDVSGILAGVTEGSGNWLVQPLHTFFDTISDIFFVFKTLVETVSIAINAVVLVVSSGTFAAVGIGDIISFMLALVSFFIVTVGQVILVLGDLDRYLLTIDIIAAVLAVVGMLYYLLFSLTPLGIKDFAIAKLKLGINFAMGFAMPWVILLIVVGKAAAGLYNNCYVPLID